MLPIPMIFQQPATGISPIGWTGSVFHLDTSLPKSTSVLYGYNTTSGTDVIRMSNLSDTTSATDAVGSVKIVGSTSSSEAYVVIPSTPLYTTGRGLTSSVTYNTSSTQSTYFIVSKVFVTGEVFPAIIRSNGATMSSPSITDGVGLLFQSNKTIDNTVGAYIGTEALGVKYLTSARGSTTETSTGTIVKVNGVTQSFNSGFTLGTDYTQTEVLSYYITNSPIDTRGKTMSFSELIFFDYRLSDSEFNDVESYLKNKWDISY